MVEVKTKFFKFTQNNSGGSFNINDQEGLGPRVWIEAVNFNHAISRALSIGIYFDGVANGQDCPCCGDRWSKPWNDEGKDGPEVNEEYDFDGHDTVYVHRIDNSIVRIKSKQ